MCEIIEQESHRTGEVPHQIQHVNPRRASENARQWCCSSPNRSAQPIFKDWIVWEVQATERGLLHRRRSSMINSSACSFLFRTQSVMEVPKSVEISIEFQLQKLRPNGFGSKQICMSMALSELWRMFKITREHGLSMSGIRRCNRASEQSHLRFKASLDVKGNASSIASNPMFGN